MYIFNLFLFVLDIDECAVNPCDVKAACLNTNGLYECSCRRGFEGDGESCTGNRLLVNSSCKPCGDKRQRGGEIGDWQEQCTQLLPPHSLFFLLQPSTGNPCGL